MFGIGRRAPAQPPVASPLLGGVAGAVLQNVLARRVAGRLIAGGGGLPGLLVGMAATYAINRYVLNRQQPARR